MQAIPTPLPIEPARPRDITPIRAGRDTTLPAYLTGLIGRSAERERIRAALQQRSARLMVLTGPGGVGKTRLAFAAAEDARDAFADGVVLVNLSPVVTEEQVVPSIAAAVGLRGTADTDQLLALKESLADRDMLLVLDNFEQIVNAAPVLTDILTSCSRISMLVTSRSLLSVYGEVVVPVQPMSLPSQHEQSPDVIARADAVELFVTRVKAIQPEFHLNARNARDIALICSRLDGIPLALELAAARTSLYSIRILAERLEKRLPVLEGGHQNVPPRLRTMRNAISWSYDLLNPVEQRLFRHLAVLLSPFNLETAADMVLGIGPHAPADEDAIMEALGSLVDKSLIQRVEAHEHDRNFMMLQILREFALERLDDAHERSDAEDRHAASIEEFAARAEPHLVGPQQVMWLNQIEVIKPDVLAAIERMTAAGAYDRALKIATSVWRYDYVRGSITDSRDLLVSLLASCPDRTQPRAKALNAVGVMSNVVADFPATEAYHSEAFEIAHQLGDERQMALAQFGLGDLAGIRGDHVASEAYYLKAEQLFTHLDDPRGIATAQTNIGHLYWAQNRLDEALKIHEAARRLYESVGDQRGMGWAFANVGRVSAELRNWAHASANLVQAMELYDLIGDLNGIAETIEAFALINVGVRDFPRAARLIGKADALHVQTGHPVPVPGIPALERCIETVRQQMGAAYDDALAEGAAMPLDDLISLAVSTPVPEDTGPTLSSAPGTRTTVDKLGVTSRELEVLTCLGNGDSDKEIADRLCISVRTVQTHVQNLLMKLDATSRSAAVARAFRLSILQ